MMDGLETKLQLNKSYFVRKETKADREVIAQNVYCKHADQLSVPGLTFCSYVKCSRTQFPDAVRFMLYILGVITLSYTSL